MDRKKMIEQLGEHFGVKPKYLNAPSFAYEIQTESEVYTVDRHGAITKKDGESVTMEDLLSQPVIKGQTVGEAKIEHVQLLEEDEESQDEESAHLHEELTGIEVKLLMESHTAESIKNIVNMLYSKQRLIMMSFETDEAFMYDGFAEEMNREEINDLEELKRGVEKLDPSRCPGFQMDFKEKTFAFCLHGSDLSPERVKAFQDLCVLIAEYAKTLTRAAFKQTQDDNPKYALRTWLTRIGMNGPEYKETRNTLLKNLQGNGAFRKVGDSDEA